MKECNQCGKLKEFKDFHKDSKIISGFRGNCKKCTKDNNNKPLTLIRRMYLGQVHRSNERNHPLPEYSYEDFLKWMLCQSIFFDLYYEYVGSGYKKGLIPSVDRTNPNKPYKLDNIKLMTWNENKIKGHSDRFNGIDNSQNRCVYRYTLEGIYINSYYSIHKASRELGISPSNIHHACNGVIKSCGGFIWKFGEGSKRKKSAKDRIS